MSLADLKDAFFHANAGLRTDDIVAQCRRAWLEEVLVCVNGAFAFQRCLAEVSGDCPDQIRLRSPRPAVRGRDAVE